MWAILREETIKFNEKTRDIAFEGLIGADLIDPGNYKKNSLALLPQTACAAAEHGDEALKKAALDKMEQGCGYVTEPSGAKHLDASRACTLLNYETLKATLLQPGAYERLVKRASPDTYSARLFLCSTLTSVSSYTGSTRSGHEGSDPVGGALSWGAHCKSPVALI